MKTVNLAQGSPEWHEHRAKHFNASDAPAMLGCSSYKSRSELLKEYATGFTAEVDAATQRRFDDGHRFEALARPLAEQIIGEDLFPVTGSEGRLSASFDGLTLMEDAAFEHKSLNDDLRAVMVDGCTGADLPKMYRVQMEQQCMVSGATRVLFMASKWAGETLIEERHCWYAPDPELRKEIAAGWAQFEADLATYTPEAAATPVVAKSVTALPAVMVQVDGQLVVRDNFDVFKAAIEDFLEHRLIREPKTDQDFADLDLQIKAMKTAEETLDAAEAQMLAQVSAIDSATKTKAMLSKLVRDNRLNAEKLLASEKERRRAEILATAKDAFAEHIAGIEKTLGGKIRMPVITADFAGVMKGKRTITTLQDAADTELARVKIEANQIADRIRVNLDVLRTEAKGFETLFMDAQALVTSKAEDDMRNLEKSRIVEHQAAEQKRLDEERARIRAEEEAKAKREADAAAQREIEADRVRIREEERQRAANEAATAITANDSPVAEPARAPAATASPAPIPHGAATPQTGGARKPVGARIKLGEICSRIAPLSITAQGLAEIGFQPVGNEGAAKLYAESDFVSICNVLSARLQSAAQMQEAA